MNRMDEKMSDRANIRLESSLVHPPQYEHGIVYYISTS